MRLISKKSILTLKLEYEQVDIVVEALDNILVQMSRDWEWDEFNANDVERLKENIIRSIVNK